MFIIFVVSVLFMYDQQELKARIKQTDRNLKFYSLLWDQLLKDGVNREELFRRLDVLLDERLKLMKQLKG